jgi:hypothetical protein
MLADFSSRMPRALSHNFPHILRTFRNVPKLSSLAPWRGGAPGAFRC